MVWTRPEPARAPSPPPGRRAIGALLCLVPRAAATGHAGPGDFFLDADGRLAGAATAATAAFVYAGAQIIDPAAARRLPRRRSSRSTRSGTR